MPEAISAYDKDCMIWMMESEIEFDTIHRDTVAYCDALRTLSFCEDGEDSEEDTQSDSLMDKISAGIKAIWEKIMSLVHGAIKAMQDIGKKQATYDDFKSSDMGSAELKKRFDKVTEEIDSAFLEARPIISAIANVLHMDPKSVESMCDNLNNKLINMDWGKTIRQACRNGKIVYHISNKYMQRLDEAEQTVLKANEELKKAKRMNKLSRKELDKLSAKSRALTHASNTFSKLATKIFGGFGKNKSGND